jgi:hypothetical protein
VLRWPSTASSRRLHQGGAAHVAVIGQDCQLEAKSAPKDLEACLRNRTKSVSGLGPLSIV